MHDNPFQVSAGDFTTTTTLECRSTYFSIYAWRRSCVIDSCSQVDLSFGSTGVLVLESMVLRAKLSMLSEFFWVHVRCRSINKGHPTLAHWGQPHFTTSCHAKMRSAPMNQSRMLNVHTSAPFWSCTNSQKHGKFWMQSNQRPTKAPGRIQG